MRELALYTTEESHIPAPNRTPRSERPIAVTYHHVRGEFDVGECVPRKDEIGVIAGGSSTAIYSRRFPLRNLGWWAGVSYTTGALMYNVGSTSFLANTFPSVNFTADMVVSPGKWRVILGVGV